MAAVMSAEGLARRAVIYSRVSADAQERDGYVSSPLSRMKVTFRVAFAQDKPARRVCAIFEGTKKRRLRLSLLGA